MTSEDIDLVSAQRMENGLNSQMVFQDENLQFNCGAPQHRVGDPGRKAREVRDYVGDKMFSVDGERYFRAQGAEFRRGICDGSPDRQAHQENQNWNGYRATASHSGDGSEGEEDEEDEEDDEDEVDGGDDEVEGLVAVDDGNKNANSSDSIHSISDKMRDEKAKNHSSFVGSSRGVLMKDGNIVQSSNDIRGSPREQHQQGRPSHYENAVTIAEPDFYYSQFLQGQEGPGIGQKEIGGDNGCGFSGRKDVVYSNESGESLRTILSDPVTRDLMDDAMILPCGHSFGSGGMQHVIRMKACYICSQSVSEDSVSPNLSLQAAVQAFRREEELQSFRASKRRRERFEQERGNYGDQYPVDHLRGRGVQFPFAVADRVIIKGNKRTPQRFVGRQAVVTTQCLNGWYVVKTLDNSESVKLQYRSLAKVSDNSLANAMPCKPTPNWMVPA